MNQKYVQIAKNAGFGDSWFENSPAGFSHPMALLLKEYTEAIVRECSDLAVVVGSSYETAVEISNAIEEHFGVNQ